MDKRPTLYMLIGLPGSGKSTYVQKHGDGCVVLSTDDIIEEIALKRGRTYNEVFKESIDYATREMNRRAAAAFLGNFDVIWDQTNLSRKQRMKKLVGVPSHYQRVAIVFPVGLEEATMNVWYERLASRRDKTIPFGVLDTMLDSFSWPSYEEGFNELRTYDEND